MKMIAAALLTMSLSLGGCMVSATFTCGSQTCNPSTQYCEETVNAGGTTTGNTCKTLPTGCTGAFCDTCLSSTNLPGRQSCGSLTFGGGAPQYSVTIRQ